MNMNKYQHDLYCIILNQIQTGATFNELVIRVLQHLRVSKDELMGHVDSVDIQSAITRLALHCAIDVNKGVITHNVDIDEYDTLSEFLQKIV